MREENDSAAEALHEEIYFGTLDAIALLGQRHDERTVAPGAIIPIVRIMAGVAPHARVRLRVAAPPSALPRPRVRVAALELRDDAFLLDVAGEVDGPTDATLARLRELVDMPQPPDGVAARVTLAGEMVELRLPLQQLLTAAPGAEPPMDRNIWGDEVLAQAAALTSFPEVTAWVEDSSYEGRPIPALALAPPTPDGSCRRPRQPSSNLPISSSRAITPTRSPAPTPPSNWPGCAPTSQAGGGC